MPATPVHHTATDDGTWDGPAQEKKLETPLTTTAGDDTFAWVDDSDDADPTTKSAWKFIHHFVSDAGLPGSASTLACSTGIGILNGARTGTTIPDADREGVWKHLAAHLKDAGVKEEDVPELESATPPDETRAASDNDCSRCNGEGTVSLNDSDVECPQCGGTGTGENNADELSHRPPATAIRGELRGVPESRVSTGPKFELREVPNGTGGTNLRFTGFASTTDTEYEMEDWLGPWVESVSSGAFGKTLSEGADVAFLLNHQGMTLARTKPGTLKLSEETDGTKSPIYGITGLHSEALLDPTNMYVQAMRSAVDRGDLDEMSFAFRVMRQEWNDEYDRRWINEVSLDKGDVSLVNYGANPTTGGTVSMRQRVTGRTEDPSGIPMVILLRRSALFRQLREGKVLSAANSEELQKALEALHAADDADIPGIVRALQDIDTAVDAGMAGISTVLDTANPDGDTGDLEPALVPPTASALVLPDYGDEARAALETLRHGPRRGAA
jgi:hypothetical protein